MLSKNYSMTISGLEAVLVDLEVDSRNGLAGQTIVGLPDTAVKESKERVLSAIKNSGYSVPVNKFLTINLAPADLRKVGTLYDLPIAIGILQSTQQINLKINGQYLLAGELGLDGQVKAMNGALLLAIMAKEKGFEYIIIPEQNVREASLIRGINIISVTSLADAIEKLSCVSPACNNVMQCSQTKGFSLDFSDVKGQEFAKRALEIAAAGNHNIFMIGPPGCGKSMLAKRIPSIFPDLSEDELIEVIKIYSISGKLKNKESLFSVQPFRSPHHTISYAGLIGGTSQAKPGEITLAHNGILFLDEIPEFSRQVLEALRQPMEDGVVHVSRANSSFSYPASFMLVASANPCPCGYSNHPSITCKCNASQKKAYQQRISGPLWDRFDMFVEMLPISEKEILSRSAGENSSDVKMRITAARNIQKKRLNKSNAQISAKEIESICSLTGDSAEIFEKAVKSYKLSARAVHKILKISRTIADMEAKENIELLHILEALQYRSIKHESQ